MCFSDSVWWYIRVFFCFVLFCFVLFCFVLFCFHFFKFGLTRCFSDLDLRRAFYFLIRTDDVLFRFGLTGSFFVRTDDVILRFGLTTFGLMTFRTDEVSDWRRFYFRSSEVVFRTDESKFIFGLTNPRYRKGPLTVSKKISPCTAEGTF